jgi:deaminated glutathione amidase
VNTQTFKVAAIQVVSSHEVKKNLDVAGELIARAAGEGAKLVGLPEYFCLMGMKDGDKLAIAEDEGSGPIQEFLSRAAEKNGVWLVGGTAPLKTRVPDRVRNACLVYDDHGKRVARYDKIHLFGFQNGAERYDESATLEAGSTPVSITSPFGRLGFSVCYDLRFPELYRSFSPVDIIFVPSAFTATTGRAHWETLLRARAIENLAFVVAPAQGGKHTNGRATWGHSMVVDPWGEILACRDEGPGVVTATIDLSRIAAVRANLPALEHRTLR